MIEALRFSSLLSRDSLAWLCVTQLRKDGDKLKQGDTHYTQWFGALARFIGLMYARYPETEIRALLHFLLRGLQQGQSLDLLVLRELLVRMGGCETLLEVCDRRMWDLIARSKCNCCMGSHVLSYCRTVRVVCAKESVCPNHLHLNVTAVPATAGIPGRGPCTSFGDDAVGDKY